MSKKQKKENEPQTGWQQQASMDTQGGQQGSHHASAQVACGVYSSPRGRAAPARPDSTLYPLYSPTIWCCLIGPQVPSIQIPLGAQVTFFSPVFLLSGIVL